MGIYCRISSDPTGERAGVQRQEADCRALAASHGWSVVRVYTDNDTSAYSGRARPQYSAMIEDVRAGELQGVVAWHPDRLTRAVRELEDLIDIVEAGQVRLATVQTGDLDLTTHNGRMNARLLGTLARYESEHRSARVTRKLEENASAGRPHGRRPYGWDRSRQPDGLLERINPVEAQVVREAAAQVLEGQSLRGIVGELNERGVPAPSGGTWQPNKIRALLLRERNAGRRVHKGQVVGRGLWEPILDEPTFDQVVAVLTDPARRTSSGSAAKHLLSGIARCGVCNALIRAGMNRGVPSYRCSASSCVSRRRDRVDDVAREAVLARLAQKDVAALFPRPEQDALRKAHREQDRLVGLRDQAGEDLIDGVLAPDQFRSLSLSLRARIEAVEHEIGRLASAAQLGDLTAFQADPEGRWANFPLGRRRAIVHALMEVRILPAGVGARSFDPRTVEIKWLR